MNKLYFLIVVFFLVLGCKPDCDCFQVLENNKTIRYNKGMLEIDTADWYVFDTDGESYCYLVKKPNKDRILTAHSIVYHFEYNDDDSYNLKDELISYLIARNVECEDPDLNGDYKSFSIDFDYEDDVWNAPSEYCFSVSFHHDSVSSFPFWQRQMCIMKQLGIQEKEMPRLKIECEHPFIGSTYIVRD